MGWARKDSWTRDDGRTATSWRGIYRDAGGREHSRGGFDRKRDAVRWAEQREAEVRRGDWVDPDAAVELVKEVAPRWLATKQGLARSTVTGYREILDSRVLPRFGICSWSRWTGWRSRRGSRRCSGRDWRPREW